MKSLCGKLGKFHDTDKFVIVNFDEYYDITALFYVTVLILL